MSALFMRRFVAVAAMAVTATACAASNDHASTDISPTVPQGTLTVDWTIRLGTNPADCALFGADRIQIHIVTQSGLDVGTFEQACEAFATNIVLDPGIYDGGARLLDAAGRPRTTVVPLQSFTILGNDQFDSFIDFPANSFF